MVVTDDPVARAELGVAPISAATRRPRRVRWPRSLAGNLGVLALLLLALGATTPLDSAVTSDEGAYALQAEALNDGAWALDYPFADADPEGEWSPHGRSQPSGDGYVILARPPVYPLVVSWFVRAFGAPIGLRVLPVLGTLAAAAAAWLLAGELAGRGRRLAFWLTAASPLLFNSLIAWAHAPSVACAGFAALAAARLGRSAPRLTTFVLLVGSLVAGVAIRREGILFAGALLAGAGAWLLWQRRWSVAVGLVPVAAIVGIAFLAFRAWSAHVIGHVTSVPGLAEGAADGYLEARLRGAWHVLAEGGISSDPAILMVSVALGLAVAAGLVVRSRRDNWLQDLALAAVAGSALRVVRTLVAPGDFILGLLAAWPVMIIGLLGRRRVERPPAERMVLGSCGLFAFAVLATQYSIGGGLEWGGRYLSPVIVPVAVAVALLLVDTVVPALRQAPPSIRRTGAAGLATLVLVPVGAGVITANRTRDRHDQLIDRVETVATVVMSADSALPRLAWRTVPGIDWLAVEDEPDLRRALRTLVDDLPERVAVYGLAEIPSVAGWEVERVGSRLYRFTKL